MTDKPFRCEHCRISLPVEMVIHYTDATDPNGQEIILCPACKGEVKHDLQ